MYVQNQDELETFHIFKNGTKIPKIFIPVKIHSKTFTLGGIKTCSEQPHLASGRFMKVFYKMTNCLRQPLLSSPKSSHLIQV